MSGHCFCTMTVEYYLTLDDDCRYTVYCPQHTVPSNIYNTETVGSLYYFTDLYNSVPTARLSNHLGNGMVLVQCSQPQRTLYDIGDQHEYQQAYHLQLERQQLQQQREQQDQERHVEGVIYVPPNHQTEQNCYEPINGDTSLHTEENCYEPTSGDAIVTDPQTENKPKSKRNIYRAAQGYLVEEPSSESDDEEPKTTSNAS